MAVSTRRPAPAKTRAPLWNEERRQAFLDTLAACSNVAASERAAGMMPGSAYRERRRSPDPPRAADLLLLRAGPHQLHCAILTDRGFIHADARLRRVAEVPGPPLWPVLGRWRAG